MMVFTKEEKQAIATDLFHTLNHVDFTGEERKIRQSIIIKLIGGDILDEETKLIPEEEAINFTNDLKNKIGALVSQDYLNGC